MAWSAPMTATAGETWTSAQWNANVRDNLLESMPGIASAAGRIFCATGLYDLAERVPTAASVTTNQTTTSTSYVDLTTVGPQVTVTTGTKALVFYSCRIGNTLADAFSLTSVAVSGATTIAASDNYAFLIDGVAANQFNRGGGMHLFTTLTAGSNTFTMRYRVGSGTGGFTNRHLAVIPL